MRIDPEGPGNEQSKEPENRSRSAREVVPRLYTFYLYISSGCNLACRHCWITPTWVNGKPSAGDCLDLDLLKSAVEEGKSIGLMSAKLTGGEPVLHPRFIDLVDYLSAEGISLTMETNGTLIDADMAKYLKNDTKLWFVSVSLDSVDPDKHDRFRGVRGAYHDAVRGIRYLVDAGFRPQVIMCPHRGNISEVEDMVRLAVELGAGSVKFNPVTPTGRGKVMDEHGETLNYDEIIKLTRFIKGELRQRSPISLFLEIPPAMASISEIMQEKNAGGRCHVKNILGILGNGEMALCGIGKNIPELCFGHLGRDSLREVWSFHPTLVKLRQDLDGEYPGICGDCIHATRCLTQCVALNYERTGKLINPAFLCEEAERRGIFPATRRRSFQRDAG
ncbi:MAG TPA: radical SAM protein [Candidatus Aminicenantes bacterium]|nr:radical SAM protein [Candidatus Aminicenantes bacterium]